MVVAFVATLEGEERGVRALWSDLKKGFVPVVPGVYPRSVEIAVIGQRRSVDKFFSVIQVKLVQDIV
jgi:hypothetical protein